MSAIAVQALEDRYTAAGDRVLLTGIQAIVRLILEQQRLDRRAGRHTAAFVSGYEGSPLGGLDLELARRRKLLDECEVVHRPALNEELAVTAIAGTQLVPSRPDARYDGVVGYWYGKAPGLDRATDAFRHANFGGTHPLGGALALVGDDPVSKSSTVPSASEQALAELALPTFYPGDSQEILDLGLHAIALSRATGLWSAMKVITNVADGAASVSVPELRPAPALPELEHGGSVFRHTPTSKLAGAVAVAAESSAYGIRMEVAREYARLNDLNALEDHGARDRVGLVAAGKTYLDLSQALGRLGLDASERERQGIRLLKLGLLFPVEPTIVERFADGLEKIIVVEEKRPFVETALKDQLYGRARAPVIVGKRDRSGAPAIPADGELDADRIAAALARVLAGHEGLERIADRVAMRPAAQVAPAVEVAPTVEVSRTPYFCSGCPHNRSTRVPAGSVVGAGIGCHTMILMMEPDRVGDVVGLTQMGGEGAQWIGMSPFLETGHLLQNMGDGTFHHSGSLAVRAAVAAGANVTFKLLYNSAVAMTGGQHVEGARSVAQLTHLLRAEGVVRVIITTEDRKRHRAGDLAAGTEVWHRDRLEEAQRVLAGIDGVTVLIHDQQCATEKRRERKRKPPSTPETRIFINERVCEGCGDCGEKSNCLSVEPVQTEYGRKTRIHQASCNTDYSCLNGDCPSFLVVRPGTGDGSARRIDLPGPADAPDLPEPSPCLSADEFAMRITGIGGTGVVTAAQIVAHAGHLAGRHVRTLDQTGLSQKAGPVVSDLKLSRRPIAGSNKLATAECDLYLACDVLVGADLKHLAVADPQRTVAVVSASVVPTGRMVVDPTASFPKLAEMAARIDGVSRAGAGGSIDARAISQAGLGSDQYANVVLLGAAYQAGALPLPLPALQGAIRLNGAAVEQNLRAFDLGRRAIAEPVKAVEPHAEPDGELERLLRDRTSDLVAYQDTAYAQSYARLVARVRQVEDERVPGERGLTIVVARNLYKLMAYKDEYEVARLSLDPQLRSQIAARFGADARYAWQLHPPLLRAVGLRRKIALGRWATPLFVALRAGRRLRGTPLDPFGLPEVRRVERRLVAQYRDVIEELLGGLHAGNHALAVQIAQLPDAIRGYEQIKLASVARYNERLQALLTEFSASTRGAPAGPAAASGQVGA
ncbi:MAG: indolepyruvate ferredoxin oxidoreductase family protein [Solirubrobacteraceae bacterium]